MHYLEFQIVLDELVKEGFKPERFVLADKEMDDLSESVFGKKLDVLGLNGICIQRMPEELSEIPDCDSFAVCEKQVVDLQLIRRK